MSDLISRQNVPDTNVGDMISRQAALKLILSGRVGDDSPVECPEECNSMLELAADEVAKMPTAEKVGKWIIHPEVKNIYGGTCIECSECGEKYVVQYIEDEKFCRNCGARMVKEVENEDGC